MEKAAISFEMVQMVITALVAVVASSGFWMYMIKQLEIKDHKSETKSLERELLIGLAHDRISFLAQKYIEKGFITQDEYENLFTYLWKPYSELGGNGTAKRMMEEVNKLHMKTTPISYSRKENSDAQ